MVLPFLLLFISLGPCTVMGQSYLTYPSCVPMCNIGNYNNPPIDGGPPCMCRPDAFPSGCQISPCGPGDTSDGDYTCQCTLYFVPNDCVLLRCDNGTTSYASIYSSCPAYSVLPGSYPTPSYPSQGYPSPGYPSPGYPSPGYPSPSYATPNYPETATCSNYCYCYGDQPPDCTESDVGPFAGGDFCACNLDSWPTGCTLKQCQAGDDQWCECSPEFSGTSCYGARCTVS